MTSHFPMSRGARRWCFTLNNYTPEEELKFWELGENIIDSDWAEYLIYGRERGEQGTPHLQGFLVAKHQIRWTTMNQRIFGDSEYGRVHWEVARSTPKNCINYCKKDGDFQEFGGMTMKPHNQWEIIKEMINDGATADRIRDRFPQTWAAYRGSIDAWINEGRQSRLEQFDGELKDKNMWIWGRAGVGKSRKAREEGERHYNKQANKWWDGYSGEDTVIIEDLDPDNCRLLVHHLKIWLDRYIFTAQVKQSSIILSPKDFRLIITSNYSPEQCFNATDLEAIRRRLKVIHMDGL